MMKCVVKERTGPGGLKLTTKPIPEVGDGDILVKVLATAVCGTDVHIQEWNEWAAKRVMPPTVIGHEFAGRVVKIGKSVTSVSVGDIVSAETHIVCNTCDLCRTGNKHVCYNTKTIGVHRDGSFAEYISFPAENAFICDPNIPIEVLSMMEPLGAAVHTVMEYQVTGKRIAVVGCGPIGIMGIAVAKKVGAAQIIAVEPNEMRAELAAKMGANLVINPVKEDPIKNIKDITGGHGVDIVLEFSGNNSAIKASIQYLKPEGKLVALGLPSKPVDFDFSEFVYKGITIKGIAGRLMYQTWEQMKGLLESGLDVNPIVTHTLSLDEYEEGLRMMKAGECCKVILKP